MKCLHVALFGIVAAKGSAKKMVGITQNRRDHGFTRLVITDAGSDEEIETGCSVVRM